MKIVANAVTNLESFNELNLKLNNHKMLLSLVTLTEYHHHHHHHHHHISVMQLGHLLTRSGLTYSEVFSKVCHDSFCHSENSVSLPWVIYYEAFSLHAVSSFSHIPVIFSKIGLIFNSFVICVFVL
jgi:hypothetical protein